MRRTPRRYERLPQKEREALERAFFQYDADLSGFLEWDEVVPALRAAYLQLRIALLGRL